MTETSPADLRLAAQMHLREGRFAESAAAYRALIDAEPHAPDLRYGLGAALSAAGDDEGAADAWSTARVFHGLALLRELGADMDRFASDPDYAAETGRSLFANGLPGVAAAAMARAVEALGPQRALIADYALCMLEAGAQEEACEVLGFGGEADEQAHGPLLMKAYALADDQGLRRSLLARQTGSALEALAAPMRHTAMTAPDGRTLKVGFAPGAMPLDMRYLATIASLDPSRIDAVLVLEDAAAAPQGFAVQPIGGLADEEAAIAVAALQLDILVDLSGPAGGRMGLFARQPAPVQVAWNGDYASTGLTRMDAKILPAGVTERDAALLFSEPRQSIGPVTAPWPKVEIAPRSAGGRFTIGAFMPPALMTAPLIAAISEAMVARPQTRLMIKHGVMDDPVIQRGLAAKFLSCGVARERIEFRSMSGDDLDLFDYEGVDLAVDSRPSMGEAQVLSTLANGIPVLCVGEPSTQGGLAIAPLAALKLYELAALDFTDLTSRIVQLHDHPERLAAIRGRIEAAFEASAYSDVRRLAGDLQLCFENLVAAKAAAVSKSAVA